VPTGIDKGRREIPEHDRASLDATEAIFQFAAESLAGLQAVGAVVGEGRKNSTIAKNGLDL
jgi:hypothetical protein